MERATEGGREGGRERGEMVRMPPLVCDQTWPVSACLHELALVDDPSLARTRARREDHAQRRCADTRGRRART
jgi:hypothetical protein